MPKKVPPSGAGISEAGSPQHSARTPLSNAKISLRKTKISLRLCTGCREMKPKKELIRAVRSPEGVVSLDFKGKSPGRGAYICRDAACLKKARKSRALERALEVPIPAGVYDAMEAELMPREAEADDG